jgi:tRNA dimethylallyltransferase
MKFPLEVLQQCWFLAGPTATGKSALSIHLAERLNGEILSMDSMAVYRGMDIGTAKPDRVQQKQVPHHLIDLIDPHEEFSTAEYLPRALNACEDILNRGRTPIFVGGTGLYLRALLRGVFEGPPADWDYRQRIDMEALQQKPGWLHDQLHRVDPVSAARLHRNDARRLVRALEIHHITGQPASALQQEHALPEEVRPRHVFWLHPPRVWLADRIDQRVEAMFAQGLEQEVRGLLASASPPGRSARQALGYRETIEWVEGRLPSLEATISLIQAGTRQFAKRQHTWFRNLEECREIMITGDESPEDLSSSLIAMS